ncbi:MAG: indole-3-glycerol phosphate synthase TrpC [Gammaproteobacteria bacterium]|nr:indole-3-glycerol phosphate synthase TrpC [Gammaproteobacteria bacterium]
MSQTPDILKKILRTKAEEVVSRCEAVSLRAMSERAEQAPRPRGFAAALQARVDRAEPAVIAEIKKASPSKGLLRADFDPAAIAADYQAGGAAALSVLTDVSYFQGDDEHLRAARAACTLPVLRKDFTVDPYQVYEARALGADCILLIVAALGDAQLNDLAGLALHLGMDVLVEVHDRQELGRVAHMSGVLLGINNRDLRTFETRLETTVELLGDLPAGTLVVTESGIHSAEDVTMMRSHDVHCFLVGEAFMRADSPGQRLRELFQLAGL